MSDKNIGIIDSPIKGAKTDDNLGLSTHAKALAEFISKSETPLTVGIQGEWGSGKTSLMNTVIKILDESFDKSSNGKGSNSPYHHIWINAWEHSLLQEPENALLNIIQEIIDKILEADKAGKAKRTFKKGLTKGSKDVFRIVSSYFNSKAGQVAEEWLNSTNTINDLRTNLHQASKEIRNDPKNPKEKIIIYVDDLDRIDPEYAVQILELLKNIFNVPGCLFVLAIDYQVVVKGLEAKFGEQNETNEYEFRAYFDKIIQLPFMMPVATYKITNYLEKLLIDTGFIENNLDEEFVSKVVYHTIGSNPRALKRLVNSLTLIRLFGKNQNRSQENQNRTEDTEQLILASLVCIQISFPKIFDLIQENPNFLQWDKDFAFRKTKGNEEKAPEFEKDFNIAKREENFDDEWEQALYRYCYLYPRLKNNVVDISIALNYVKSTFEDYLGDDFEQEFHLEMINILNKTSVTSVSDTSDSESRSRKKQSDHFTYYEGFKDWIDQINDNPRITYFDDENDEIPPYIYSMVKDLHDHMKENYKTAIVDYSKTGGASFSVDESRGSKFMQIRLKLQKREQSLELLIARDHKNGYVKPKYEKLEVENIRKYPFNDEQPVPWGYQFFAVYIYTGDEYENNKEQIFKWIDRAYKTCTRDKKLSVGKNDDHTVLEDIFYPEEA